MVLRRAPESTRPWTPYGLVVGWDLLDATTTCLTCITTEDWGIGDHPTRVYWIDLADDPTEMCSRCHQPLMKLAAARLQ